MYGIACRKNSSMCWRWQSGLAVRITGRTQMLWTCDLGKGTLLLNMKLEARCLRGAIPPTHYISISLERVHEMDQTLHLQSGFMKLPYKTSVFHHKVVYQVCSTDKQNVYQPDPIAPPTSFKIRNKIQIWVFDWHVTTLELWLTVRIGHERQLRWLWTLIAVLYCILQGKLLC